MNNFIKRCLFAVLLMCLVVPTTPVRSLVETEDIAAMGSLTILAGAMYGVIFKLFGMETYWNTDVSDRRPILPIYYNNTGKIDTAVAAVWCFVMWKAFIEKDAWEDNLDIPSETKVQIRKRIREVFGVDKKIVYRRCLKSFPFGKINALGRVNLVAARKHLDSTHYGISHVKEAILDYLSGLWASGGNAPKILCFDGVPGTGKTTLAESIAEVLGKEFAAINVSRSSVADLCGSRREVPGLLAQALIDTQSTNPVILLDEFEKTSKEVLSYFLTIFDPSQNSKVGDSYLGFDMDLSKVTFVATVNSLAALPEPLRNRMQIIHLHPYSLAERRFIARKMLIPQIAEHMNLNKNIAERLDGLVDPLAVKIMRMEGGMRAFKRCLVIAAEKYVRQLIEHSHDKKEVDMANTAVLKTVSCDDVLKSINPELLGDSPEDLVSQQPLVGVANGLQVNGHDGGGLFKLEAIVIPHGKGKLMQGLKAGETFRQTQMRVFAYVKTIAALYGILPKTFRENDFIFGDQINSSVDGPSAGLAHVVALVSALTGRPVKQDFAMTGAIDMHGNVLPVGGYRDKILGSEQPGITNIIVPAASLSTIEAIRESFPNLNIYYVSNVHEALELLLEKVPATEGVAPKIASRDELSVPGIVEVLAAPCEVMVGA